MLQKIRLRLIIILVKAKKCIEKPKSPRSQKVMVSKFNCIIHAKA